MLESVYEHCLCHEFRCRGVPFQSQLSLPVLYDGFSIEAGLRIDLIVDERIIVELKATEVMHPIYTAQLLTYLKLTDLRLGSNTAENLIKICNVHHEEIHRKDIDETQIDAWLQAVRRH